jgi:hypothetical protein
VTDTTQDKPAVGPLSAGDWTKHNGSCVQLRGQRVDVRKADGSEWLDWIADQWGLDWIWHRGEERAPSDIVEFRLSSLAPTAPVEASGSEDKRRREITAVMSALDRFEDIAGRVTATQAEHVLASLAALRPQPSGETLQSLAQAFEDAMEGSHGAWAVSGDEGQAGGETREAVTRVEEFVGAIRGLIRQEGRTLDPADLRTILALLRPAAPDGGGEAWAWLAAHPSMELSHCYGDEDDDPAWQVHERSGNRSDREWKLVASGPTPLEAVRSAIPASEGGEG